MNELLNDLLAQIRLSEAKRSSQCERLMMMFYNESSDLIKAMEDEQLTKEGSSTLQAMHKQTLNLWWEVRNIIYDRD